ncbi:hypothetical protein C882_0683 [Caenispirillum salinarum AK4]|uniref:Uncharacterized protein n=1 Tax=Caenispirillum salinarum AK4 TaxID=1238182 RepID=K9GVY1_9PROT|nr:hypothetical protein [Caenispirillum salinarum]EKV28919.1 hypothetical protein C882_0683 [Caenispirillum salinarum AK4]
MDSVIGVIIMAQESRFRLVDRADRAWHFMLAPDANVEPQDLPPLFRDGREVHVAWSNAPGVTAALAHDVSPQPHEQEAPA